MSETRATRGGGSLPGTHFICFTSKKLHVLMAEELRERREAVGGTRFTCFTSTKVPILTAEGLRERREAVGPGGVPLRGLREEERGERGT
jgi:hypothetical protein